MCTLCVPISRSFLRTSTLQGLVVCDACQHFIRVASIIYIIEYYGSHVLKVRLFCSSLCALALLFISIIDLFELNLISFLSPRHHKSR